MAEAEKSKDRERSRSPIDEESNSEDSDSSMTTSDGELEGDVESMDDSETLGRKSDAEKKPRPFRSVRSSRGASSSRERGSQEKSSQELARERQQRLLNLLLPPWMRLGASRWAGAGGIASHTSRSRPSGAVRRKREEGESDEEEGEKSEAVFERKVFWTCSKDTGFPHRVNHAVAGYK